MRRPVVAVAAMIAVAGAAVAGAAAQHQQGSHGAPPAALPATPYAGLERRAVASLSEQQLADLRAGRGMGFALAAELNGYPGPAHAMELAQPLGLTHAQEERIRALQAAMKAEAVPLGERLIAQESDLDASFRERTVTPAGLRERTAAIALTQGALREAHLKYHLATVEVLTQDQVARYGALRGYGGR